MFSVAIEENRACHLATGLVPVVQRLLHYLPRIDFPLAHGANSPNMASPGSASTNWVRMEVALGMRV